MNNYLDLDNIVYLFFYAQIAIITGYGCISVYRQVKNIGTSLVKIKDNLEQIEKINEKVDLLDNRMRNRFETKKMADENYYHELKEQLEKISKQISILNQFNEEHCLCDEDDGEKYCQCDRDTDTCENDSDTESEISCQCDSESDSDTESTTCDEKYCQCDTNRETRNKNMAIANKLRFLGHKLNHMKNMENTQNHNLDEIKRQNDMYNLYLRLLNGGGGGHPQDPQKVMSKS